MNRGRAARNTSSAMSITTGGKAEISFRHALSREQARVWGCVDVDGIYRGLGMMAHRYCSSMGSRKAIAGFCTATTTCMRWSHSVGLDPIDAFT